MIRSIAVFVLFCSVALAHAETSLGSGSDRMHSGEPAEDREQVPGCLEAARHLADAACGPGKIHRKQKRNAQRVITRFRGRNCLSLPSVTAKIGNYVSGILLPGIFPIPFSAAGKDCIQSVVMHGFKNCEFGERNDIPVVHELALRG